jgi:K+-transporting ATPase KdpF subunit
LPVDKGWLDMDFMDVLAGLIVVGLLIYLFVALMKPEWLG